MSGELYEVFGQGRFVPSPTCPEELRGSSVKLRPSDSEELIEVKAEVACVAARVQQRLLDGGGDAADIRVPVKRATLSKVLEYMKYHSEIPPGDLRTPLASEDLLECGATRWDVSFINVDRKMLVELLYAASALDIPTLCLLAKVKASTMMVGKSPDEIRKDYSFSNDLPKSEEMEIRGMVADLRKKRNLAADDAEGIAQATALVGSVWRLAEAEASLEDGGREAAPAPGPRAPPGALSSWRQGSWRAAVVEDWQRLAQAPAEVRADRELLLAALPLSRGRALGHASDDLRADRKVVLSAVACGGESLREAAESLRCDRDFVMEAVLIDGMALAGAAEALRGDRDLVLRAAQAGRGVALKGALATLRADADFVLECAEQDAEALSGAADELREQKDFVLKAVGRVGASLRYAPLSLRADRDVVEAAVASDPSAALYAHAARRADLLAAGGDGAAGAAEPGEVAHTGTRHAGVPLTVEAAREGCSFATFKLQKSVVFTALSTITPNMGQSNYIAANAFLDKLAPYERPEIDSTGLMWGTVGGMGMRWKAFASADFMNATPELLMGIEDAAKVLHVVATRMEMPEWVGANYMDPSVRQALIEHGAKLGGYRPSEDAYLYPSIPRTDAAASVGPRAGLESLLAPWARSGGGKPTSGFSRPARAVDGGDGGTDRDGGGSPSSSSSGRRRRLGAREDDAGAAPPLGGWPALHGSGPAAAVAPRPPFAGAAPMAPGASRASGAGAAAAADGGGDWELAVGAQVQLVGLRNKSGTTGVVVKAYPEGRYKVALDGQRGSALLRPEYLKVIAPASAILCC